MILQLCARAHVVAAAIRLKRDASARRYYENNITGTVNLLAVMHDYNCTHLVYSSSATVYGTPRQIPIPESTPLAPESVYGRTKMMAELIIRDICDAYTDSWRAISLRYFK